MRETRFLLGFVGLLVGIGWLVSHWAGGGSPATEVYSLSGPAQGSTYHVSYWHPTPVDQAALEQAITAELARIDLVMSNYRADSVIEQFNQTASTQAQDVGDELVALVEQARQISSASQGCYDLTIKPLFDLWGFKADKFHRPTADELTYTLQSVGMAKLAKVDSSHLQKQVPTLRFDVSSIAQGYTVDKLADILRQYGIHNFLVEVGGEMVVEGQKPADKPWRVAIDKPLPGEQKLQKIIEIHQTKPISVVTSGTYRHYFDEQGQRFSHVLNPKTGQPVQHHTVSTTVIMDNGTLGDGWSTAFLCLGSEAGLAIADQLAIPVLFIDQVGEQLIERPSKALTSHSGIQLQAIPD